MSAADPALALAGQHYGEGPPLLVLHGLLGSSRNWQGIAKQLGRGRSVWTLDLRNHGLSPWSDEMSYPAMAGDLARHVAAHAGGMPVDLLGHSMGGKAAMALALLRPELVARLIVADVAPVAYAHSFLPYIQAMRAIDLAGTDRTAADRALAATIPEAPIRAFLIQNLERGGEGWRWRPNLPVLADAMAAITGFPEPLLARRYPGRTLFLHGGRSDYVRLEHGPPIRKLFPRAEMQAIEAAGHWLHADAPAAFLARVEAFLAGPAATDRE